MPSNAGVVFSYQAEACETRVLLTTTGDDQASETLLNDNEAAYLSPYENEVDDSVQSYVADTGQLSAEADEYTSVINSPVGEFFEPLSEAYGQAMLESASELASAEDEANSEQQAAETSAGNDASESTTESIDSAFSLFADDPDPAGFASGLLATGTNTSSGDSAGTTAGSTDSSGGGDSDADSAAAAASGPGWTPLQFPANVKFQETSLSAMDESSDWTAFQPTGTSHTTITTTASTAEPVSVSTAGDSTGADGATSVDSDLFASSPANLQTTVTTSEQYNSDSEWTVTQSYTNTFDTTINDWSAENDQAEQSNDDQAQENVNLGVLTRTGIENVTVDIVDGVSRTITYTITDTVSYEVGTLPGEDENTTDEEKWSIPQQWIDSSRQSVNPEEAPEDQDDGPPLMFSNWQADSESTDSGDITAVNWETADTAAEQQNSGSSGGRFRSSNSLTFQVGETLVTMPDGATAKAYTFSFSTSSSMFSKVAGDPGFSLTFGTLTEDPSQGNGIQVGISSSFFFFASASTSTSFTASAVVPDGGSLLDLDISGAFAFAVSFMSGGTTEGSIGLQLQMSSGSTADDSDTHTAFGYSAMTASSGFNHFNFDVSIPFGNQSTTDNTSDSTSNDTSDSDDGDVSELDAEGLVVQLSLGRISSSNSGRTIFYSGKQRLTGEGVISHKTESILVDQSTSSSDQNFEIAVGTEENLIDIGFSGAKSTLVEYAGNADVHEMLGQHKGSESGSDFVKYNLVEDYFEDTNSTWKFGFALGGEVSFGFENESSAEGEIISNSKELWTNVNGVFGLIVHEELTYTAADGSGTSNYRRTEQSLGTGDDTVKERVEPTSWSPEDYVEDPDKEGRPLQDILDEYEDRKRNILRWEELLSKETDPAKRRMLENMISGEQNILSVLRQEALAAGATKDQLGISDKQAAEEARNNPIDPNEPFTSPSGTESSGSSPSGTGSSSSDWVSSYSKWFLSTQFGGWLYTGMSNPDDDVLSDAGLAAGESYLENGALGHEALETLGPLGIAVSLGLEGLEGEELNNALFENMPPGPAQVGPMFIPPPFQLIPWNQAVMMGIRDYSAWVFATARFGQFMHENFGQVFADEYGVDLEDIIDNTAPGQNGPDLQLPSGMGRELGLEDNIELKPWTNGGVDRLFPQIERWGFPVSPFFYDYDGNIWHAPEILD